MAQEELAVLLRQVIDQLNDQQQAMVGLTEVLDRYLGQPVKIDANNSPVSFKEGSAVNISNEPTVAAKQAGAWSIGVNNNVGVTRVRQNWEFKVVIGREISSPDGQATFLNQITPLGAQGWELVNITGYPVPLATFKRPI